MPNGLYCGNVWNDSSIKNNIFHHNNFLYKSNNENFKDRLPEFKSGDIITILSYDSNNDILSFGKENDNGKLNAQISHLPKGNTYYWFILVLTFIITYEMVVLKMVFCKYIWCMYLCLHIISIQTFREVQHM